MSEFTCPNCDVPYGADYITGPTTPHRHTMTLSNGASLVYDLCDGCHERLMRKPNQAAKRYPLIARKVTRKPGEYVIDGGAA